jgi:dynein heavy chain
MVLEPPQGLRMNMLRTYLNMNDMDLNDCARTDVYKRMLFSLSLFHAVLQDRRKFGPIGWNNNYDFTSEDLSVSKKQLKLLLEAHEEVPYSAIYFMVGRIHYGGKITDPNDMRLLETLL